MKNGVKWRPARSVSRNFTLASVAAVAVAFGIPGNLLPTCATSGGHQHENEKHQPDDVGYDASYNVDRRNMVQAIADLYQAELKRQEEMSLEDAIRSDNGPKEISIYCHQAPEVKIVDLAQDHRGNNECLILHVNAPDVSSKLMLKCDGSVSGSDFGWGENW